MSTINVLDPHCCRCRKHPMVMLTLKPLVAQDGDDVAYWCGSCGAFITMRNRRFDGDAVMVDEIRFDVPKN